MSRSQETVAIQSAHACAHFLFKLWRGHLTTFIHHWLVPLQLPSKQMNNSQEYFVTHEVITAHSPFRLCRDQDSSVTHRVGVPSQPPIKDKSCL